MKKMTSSTRQYALDFALDSKAKTHESNRGSKKSHKKSTASQDNDLRLLYLVASILILIFHFIPA